jgi:hypothetical protein
MSIVMNTMKWKEENVEEDEKELRVARSWRCELTTVDTPGCSAHLHRVTAPCSLVEVKHKAVQQRAMKA